MSEDSFDQLRQRLAARGEQRIKESLARFSESGIIGKPRIEPSGELAYEVPTHTIEFMQWLLSHPEKWDEVPAFQREGRKALLQAMRDQAIANGFIKP